MATPGKNKTNFKTYEASTRLLAAVIATNNIKLDYAELARHVGGGATKDAINHRLRPIKQLAKMQATCVSKGEDPGELPADKGEIHKLFGESTPDGIEWQFRSIKNLGKSQKAAVKKGENPATLLVAGTPGGRKRGAVASTPGSGATVQTPGTGARGRKRGAPTALPVLDSSDENGDNDSDYRDAETPSKRPSKRAKTVGATATPTKVNGSVTTPAVTPARTTVGTPTPAVSTAAINGSIFGNGGSAPAAMPSTNGPDNGVRMVTAYDAPYHSPATKSAARPTVIKKEFANGMNPFIDTGSFGDFEDGEI